MRNGTLMAISFIIPIFGLSRRAAGRLTLGDRRLRHRSPETDSFIRAARLQLIFQKGLLPGMSEQQPLSLPLASGKPIQWNYSAPKIKALALNHAVANPVFSWRPGVCKSALERHISLYG
jgi:hypothetical protein